MVPYRLVWGSWCTIPTFHCRDLEDGEDFVMNHILHSLGQLYDGNFNPLMTPPLGLQSFRCRRPRLTCPADNGVSRLFLVLWTDLLVIQGSLRGSESLTFTQLLCLPPRNSLWFDLMLPCLSASVCDSSPQPPDTLIFTSSSRRLESAVLWTMDKGKHTGTYF